MGSVADTVAEVRGILRDAGADLYSDALIQAAVLAGEVMTATTKPESVSDRIEIATAAGSLQALPATHFRLLDLLHNGPASAPRRSINLVGRETLDRMTPNWRSATPVDDAREYVYDERNPLQFELSPPVKAGTIVGLLAKRPTPYTNVANDELTVDAMNQPAVIEWALYRLFSEDTEGTVNEARSRKHYGNFFNFFGIKLQNEARNSPRQPEHKV